MATMSKKTTLKASIGREHYRVKLQARQHSFLADEPLEAGGADSGPAPDEYILAALASCTAATLRMYADRKGFDLESVELELSLEVVPGTPPITHIKRLIQLHGHLDAAQRQRLLEIANKCPVHRILSNPIDIHTELL